MLNNIQGEILPLEKKQTGGKILPHSGLRGGGGWGLFLEEASCTRKGKRDFSLSTWNVRSLYRAGSIRAAARELARYTLGVVTMHDRWVEERTL
jgi:hypothetical protein